MNRKPTYEELTQLNYELQKQIVATNDDKKTLQESETKYKTLVHNIPGMVYRGYSDWSSEVVSGSLELCGYTEKELNALEKKWLSLIHPDDRQKVIDEANVLKEQVKALVQTYRIISKDGLIRIVEDHKKSLFSDGKEFLGIDGIVFDITDRVQAEKDLVESEERFRLTLDATSDGVWDRNIQTVETYYGENWAKMLGYEVEEIVKENLNWEKLLHPADKPSALAKVKDHLDGRTSRYRAEFRLRNKTGNWQWILARGKVVARNEDGSPLRFVGTHTDISIRKEAEKTLRQGHEKIKFFAYSLVHDLKGPSIAIQGLIKLFYKKYGTKLDEKGKDFCERITKSSEEITALVEQINTYISTKEASLSINLLNLKELFQLVHEEFSARLTDRQIHWIEPKSVPSIRADKLSILRILRNLIDNALKYGGEDLSEIKITYKEFDDYHIISVGDNGAGIKSGESKGIFHLFKRSNTSEDIEGSGLGLTIVKEIAEQHGGKVWYEAGSSKGATFNFSIAKNL